MKPATLGAIMIGVGALGLLRVLPEALSIPGGNRLYLVVATLDVVLSSLTVAAGVGLLRGKSWAPTLALRTGGIVVATSLGWGLLLLPEVLRNWPAASGSVLVPRLVFYLITLAFWPYAVLALVHAAPPETRKSLRGAFGISLSVGGVLMVALYMTRG